MEISNISNFVTFEIARDKSAKGNDYKGIFLVVRDKDGNVLYKHLIDFLHTKYDELLSLVQNTKKGE